MTGAGAGARLPLAGHQVLGRAHLVLLAAGLQLDEIGRLRAARVVS